jgi:dTDP-4-amino-4,6-dideoxygalactose transaminase
MSAVAKKDDLGFDLPLAFIDLQAQRAQIADKLEAATKRVMEQGQFIMGPDVKELEAKLAEFCGAKYCLSCSNGTDALGLVLRAKNVKAGDAVFVPSFTFAATAEVVSWLGATAVFIDSEEDSFNMCANSLKKGIERAKAEGLNLAGIVPVDLFGLAADYDVINAIAKEHDMWVMADSAQGFAAEYKGGKAGALADVTTTSFFPAKPLGCYGDGGAVFTDDEGLYSVLQSLRVHGKGTDKYDNVRIGMNARLDTMQAAILLEKLELYAGEIDERNRVADRYAANLQGVVKTPVVADGYRSVWAQYTLTLDRGVDRAAFQAHMKEAGVPTVVYYPRPLHTQTAYKDGLVADENGHLPVCEDLATRVVSLPMHPYLTNEQIDYVCEQVKAFFA